MQYLILTDEPFRGIVQSVIKRDGTVAYTDGLTPEAYAIERGVEVKVISEEELHTLLDEYVSRQITEPVPETLKAYVDALEVLPPSRWMTHRGVEMFHICERISHDLVSWHGRIGARCFTFTDRASLPADEIAEKINMAYLGGNNGTA